MIIIRFLYDNTHNANELRNDKVKLYFKDFNNYYKQKRKKI